LIWFGETKKRGALIPFTVTELPASSVGSGILEAVAIELARPVPKIDTIDPGEIGWA
jgi:hypothetical protein